MVFETKLAQWRTGMNYPVDANDANNELERIRKQHGELTPKIVVDESRDNKAVLHKCFEWNDNVAAEKYREYQARNMIGSLIVYKKTAEHKEIPVRAFANIEHDYKPIQLIMESQTLTEKLLENALRELRSFQVKYANLKELAPVFEAIEKVEK